MPGSLLINPLTLSFACRGPGDAPAHAPQRSPSRAAVLVLEVPDAVCDLACVSTDATRSTRMPQRESRSARILAAASVYNCSYNSGQAYQHQIEYQSPHRCRQPWAHPDDLHTRRGRARLCKEGQTLYPIMLAPAWSHPHQSPKQSILARSHFAEAREAPPQVGRQRNDKGEKPGC